MSEAYRVPPEMETVVQQNKRFCGSSRLKEWRVVPLEKTAEEAVHAT
jgi:hypothetical protein